MKIYLYAAVAAIAAAVIIGSFVAGRYSGKLAVAHRLDTLEIARQKEITALTLAVSKKQKEIDEKSVKTVEIFRNVKDPTACGDVAIPADVATRLRVGKGAQ